MIDSIGPRTGNGRHNEERRLRRILEMAVLMAREPLTRVEIAERYNITVRQVSNDFALMRAAGIEISRYHVGGTPRIYRFHATIPGLVAMSETRPLGY